MKNKQSQSDPWKRFHGPNLGYLNTLYEKYSEDPGTVEPDIREIFDQWGAPPLAEVLKNGVANGGSKGKADRGTQAISKAEQMNVHVDKASIEAVHADKIVALEKLAQNIRTYGHCEAKVNPLKQEKDQNNRLLDPEYYGLSEEDLKGLPATMIWPNHDLASNENAFEGICRLKKLYTGPISFEFHHVHHLKEREWLTQMVESGELDQPISTEDKIELLQSLTKVETFEKFLHRTFVGQKRFSIEGLDSLVPLINELIRSAVSDGVQHTFMGMAHRGRLNVLAHILEKPYEAIFAEFHNAPNQELVPSEGSVGINYGWSGDVKYHLGASRKFTKGSEVSAKVTLANNPSHLEFVNPVVEGFTRAAQEKSDQAGYPEQKSEQALAILVHGDAAFPGQGVVTETLNLSRLRGYKIGGSIHIIANNRIGFTTEMRDARSTKYASDPAKGFEIPIIHVNADDPEACLAAARLACKYRLLFQKDFLIDLVGYRRYGHNETDDPSTTHFQLYDQINNHSTVRRLYADQLLEEGIISAEAVDEMEKQAEVQIQAAYKKLKEQEKHKEEYDVKDTYKPTSAEFQEKLDKINTAVPIEALRKINENLLIRPEGFTIYPKLERILKRREEALLVDGYVDWGLAETLAFATILKDGTAIRLTGQDSERGTFAHRHLILHDAENERTYSPLHTLPEAKASFSIYNSPLSEAAAMGFEYGYDSFAANSLVLWEAQFGDFVNAAQVLLDQFLAAGKAKWGQQSGLVLLLPHGYEGQGPEHSSARLERFLQQSAENNWTVVNVTKAAQYFHLLRRQAAELQKNEARPLVIMSPKSLIREKRVYSPSTAFSEGRFEPILEQEGLGKETEKVKRLLFCSGKVAVDLEAELNTEEHTTLHIVRIEQLYPFPESRVSEIIERFKNLQEVVWVQEEPQNMGPWTYMEPKLKALLPESIQVKYVGRQARSSPAEGQPNVHKKEQIRIVREALSQ
ncbi:2-oxoglutarate dehydrogenase E1 component [Bacillus horti]|uniref:2-oxoglutarate dehydrogenase E1 component n=2 Tax=Caldalkalibacillus horti TaxID=77523 RepID=A0ABT9W1B8_9BACI|nr:2-oxoglutarate dehydrogenase E1 component [Bacillus horti]